VARRRARRGSPPTEADIPKFSIGESSGQIREPKIPSRCDTKVAKSAEWRKVFASSPVLSAIS
jgi:hypothetical protein